ncbi:hypothetical protein NEOLEDRAFT_1240380 [Neolentinus lepideus HHB14362 ss-1]|uniref:Uncharacterized protein n=1 Tax=Neolentinus lepideus HHB14362 ss-1 TaxID=1314782 RepID=A0A165U070_9AGAM|nr:hypothetical protein NEOLEDRAFT_1240380 [Neolentinus lepideus HHB14362 ss-1]
MAPEDKTLRALCHKPETLAKARTLLRTAKAKTRPGSGHELGDGIIGLSAICAYVASLELDNDDVTESVAQITSCLAPKIFANTLNTVRAVLTSSDFDATNKVKYEDLIVTHKVLKGDLVVGWMNEAEETLLKSGEVRIKSKADETLVKCSVFYWTAQVLSLTRIKPQHLIAPYSIELDDLQDVVQVMNSVCSAVSDRIKVEVNRLKAAARQPKTKQHIPPATSSKATTAKTATPSKTKTPSKPSLKRSLPTPSVADPESVTPSKRRVVFVQRVETADTVLQTPVKKRRVYGTHPLSSRSPEASMPASSARTQHLNSSDTPVDGSEHATSTVAPECVDFTSSAVTPRRSTRRSVNQLEAPTSQVTNEQQEPSDDEDEEDGGLPRSKHFRPPFIDRDQWFRQDPKVDREWKMAEAYKQKMVDAYGYPLARLRPAFDWKTASPVSS